MSQSQQERLEAARVDAVKSATEIINGISKSLTFKDIDLLLINTFILPKEDSIYQVCDEWADRDYRQVGLLYGGSFAILSLILIAMHSFIFLPLVLFFTIFARFIVLRRALTQLSHRRATHQFTMDIARYVILRNKIDEKKTTFRDISTKYITLKYARDRNAISGCDFIRLFVSLDMEIDFYSMLHGVIDDVLEYVIDSDSESDGEGRSASLTESSQKHQEDESSDHWEHDSDPQEFLNIPPKDSNSYAAQAVEKHFASELSNNDEYSETDHEDLMSDSKNALDDDGINEGEVNSTELKDTPLSVSSNEEDQEHESVEKKEASTSDHKDIDDDDNSQNSKESLSESNDDDAKEENNEFPLDDFEDDLDGMDISAPETSEDDDEEEDEDETDINDDVLRDFGLSDEDFK